MLNRADLLALLASMPAITEVNSAAIPGEDVSGNTLRAVIDGQLAVIAGTSQKQQFAALMEILIHLYLLDENSLTGPRQLPLAWCRTRLRLSFLRTTRSTRKPRTLSAPWQPARPSVMARAFAST